MDTQTRKTYNYYAFISYSRKDEAWAKWIQKRLETYRIPSIIRKQNLNVPQKLYPIFRDKTDLTGGKLLETLQQELEDSQYLIVICSPNSAGSEWVNKEILHFIKQGREEYIIPLIIDGVPLSEDPKNECYPKALMAGTESEILGISISELGKEKAFLRVVATLLNLKFDQLVMRDRRRRIKQRAFATISGLLLLVLALAGLWYNTPHSAYYQDYVYRFEVPVGLYPLTKAERRKRAESYRIVTQRGKVIRLERVNSLGTPVQPLLGSSEDDPPVVRFFYERDHLSRAELYNQLGNLVLVKDYTSNLKAVDFQRSDDSSLAFALPAVRGYHSLDQDISSGASRSDITRYLQTYDENGYLTEVRFMRDNRNTPVMDSNGDYGLRYEREASGQISRVAGLDEDGNLHNCRYGYAIISYRYNEKGQIVECGFLDADEQKTQNKYGYFAQVYHYNDIGNIVAWNAMDKQGNFCCNEEGVYQTTFTYNEQGLMNQTYYWDMDGNPVCSISEGIHGFQRLYDEKGYLRSVEYYDDKGLPACNSNGYSRVEYNVDRQGFLKEEFYFAYEEPAFDRETWVAGIRYETDEYGRTICETALDTEHHPFICRQGRASTKYQYNPSGNVSQYSYYDEEGKAICAKEGYATVECEYDTLGNLTRVVYRDEQGNACLTAGGYAEVSFTYNAMGNEISEKYYDAEGNPTIVSYGYHEVRMEYDSHSNRIRDAFYDTEGHPLIPSLGYAAIEYDYDEYGRQTDYTFYGTDGTLAKVDGYCRVCMEYDIKGNLIQETKYPETEYAPDGSSRVAVTLYEYDERANLVKISRFDGDGQPRTANEHESVTLYTYDGRNRMVMEEALDTSGKPYGIRRREYNDRNQLVTESLYSYDKEAEQGSYHYSYDEFGNFTSRIICSPENRALFYEEYQYNMTGDLIEAAYYDHNHALYPREDGSRIEYDYDVFGNIVQVWYYDENDKLNRINVTEYNLQGWKLSEAWTDSEGRPSAPEGYAARVQHLYDTGGRETGRIYYAPDGKVMTSSGWMVVLQNIEEGSPAALAGIHNGDLLLQYNEWELFLYSYFTAAADALTSTLQQSQESDKTIVVCRGQGEDAEFYEFHLGPGMSGMFVSDQLVTIDMAEAVRAQYTMWKNTETQSEERNQTE